MSKKNEKILDSLNSALLSKQERLARMREQMKAMEAEINSDKEKVRLQTQSLEEFAKQFGGDGIADKAIADSIVELVNKYRSEFDELVSEHRKNNSADEGEAKGKKAKSQKTSKKEVEEVSEPQLPSEEDDGMPWGESENPF